jgi:hypothetical protein
MNEEKRQAMAPALAKHKEGATAQVASLKAVGADAKTAPPVAQREPAAVPLATLTDSGDPESAGVLIGTAEWLTAAGGTNEAKVPLSPRLSLANITRCMEDGYLSSSSPSDMETNFTTLKGLKQAAVVRVRDYTKPKIVFAAGSKRFEGARASGDVIVYDLATRKRIGAFPFEAGQSGNVSVLAKDEAGAEKELEQAFAIDVEQAVRKEYAAFAAGTAGPSAPGTADDAERKRFADKIRMQVLTDHFLSNPTKVEITSGPNGKPLVTIWSSNLPQVALPDGSARPEVVQTVTKVLGREADVKVLAAEK